MADAYPVAGCKFYIGVAHATSATDLAATDFTATGQTYTLVDGWQTMGAFGDNAALITTNVINRGRDLKQKGTANAGQMQNHFLSIPSDPGQVAAIAAAAPSDQNNYAFKIELNDPGTGGTPSIRYFVGLVMSAQEQGGQANTARLLQVVVEINSNVVSVAAA